MSKAVNVESRRTEAHWSGVGTSWSEAEGVRAGDRCLKPKVAEPRPRLWEGEAEGDGRGGPGVEASG